MYIKPNIVIVVVMLLLLIMNDDDDDNNKSVFLCLNIFSSICLNNRKKIIYF